MMLSFFYVTSVTYATCRKRENSSRNSPTYGDIDKIVKNGRKSEIFHDDVYYLCVCVMRNLHKTLRLVLQDFKAGFINFVLSNVNFDANYVVKNSYAASYF